MKNKKRLSIIIIVLLLVSIITLTISYSNKNQELPKIEKAVDGLILIPSGEYKMGSPKTENWRSEDEVEHEVEISEFYINQYEVTQKEFEEIMGYNPSYFRGENLPVENISWYEAIEYCNLLSKQKGLTPAYKIEEDKVIWNLSANGYRLPTEAEWEYASRAGITSAFNTENSISINEANYNGTYPYEIEDYYFNQDKLETKPSEYRQKTIDVGDLVPNKWGLYDMHGNVREWVYDYYDEYDLDNIVNPIGPENGTYKIVRGGSWNDSAKHLRNAYRSIVTPTTKSFDIGFRIVRNSTNKSGEAITKKDSNNILPPQNILVIYFDENTEKIAQKIKETRPEGIDIFKIELQTPYSTNNNDFIKESILDLKNNNLPLINQIETIEKYDTVIIGYSNWWSSLPMPIVSFLEEYNLAGKTIIPFCVHNGEYSGQSISELAKLSPYSNIGPNLIINNNDTDYENIIKEWLTKISLI